MGQDGEASAPRAETGGSARQLWPWFRPPVLSLAYLILATVVFLALGLRSGQLQGQAWTAWRLVATLAICAAAALFFRGCMTLSARRTVDPRSSGLHEVKRRVLFGYLLLAAVFAAAVLVILTTNSGAFGPEFAPGSHMSRRSGVVVIACAIAVTPWLMLVWLTHSDSRRLRKPPIQIEPLLMLRGQLNACVLAFASFVVIALVPTGALRAFWLTTDRRGSFGTVDVLLYGAFFAVALATVTLPLLGSWRRTAAELVEDTYPMQDIKKVVDDKSDREGLEDTLGLTKGLLQSPLTLLSFLTPLVTSLLAAFVPELAAP